MHLKEASLPSLLALTGIFILSLVATGMNTEGFAFFIYGLTIVHVIWALLNKWFRKVPLGRSIHICNLAMFTISCFTLNRMVEIFATFTPWVYIALIILFIVLLADAYIKFDNVLWKFIYGFVLTTGFFVALYFSILLMPMYVIGFFGIIAFGLGIHLFIPAILCFTLIYYLYQRRDEKVTVISLAAGLLFAIGSLVLFFSNINKANKVLEKVNFQFVTAEDKSLPRWVYIAQALPVNKWTEMIVVGDFKYELFDEWFMDRGINSGTSLADKGLHEPFLNIARLTGDHKIDLNDQERLMVLKTNFNSRHETSRKLWSGENLVTNQCITDVKLYPEYRLAYTQKTFFIKNTMENGWRNEEALYTLHLPKDAVVNSMSLWVNGVERKSYLTTQEKADSAYVQIVGVQNRDPALLHWQEGHRVSVTVFPCNSKEIRILKVGYTTPMKVKDKSLVYENIFVEGPSFEHCRNDISITSIPANLKIETKGIKLETEDIMQAAHFKGNSEWELSTPLLPLSSQTFSFNHKSFILKAETRKTSQLIATNLVLDLNASWNKSDFDKIMEQNKSKKIWYAPDENTLQQVNETNAVAVWEMMHKRNFQLMPLYAIDVSNSVLVTKPVTNSPAYADLDSSRYAQKLSKSVTASSLPLKCLNLSGDKTDYFYSTLHDMNYLHCYDVNIQQCLDILSKGELEENIVDSTSVNIDDADMNIEMSASDSNTGAPDHLMRLYNYKKILVQSGKFYFDKSSNVDLRPSVEMSNEAFVVTPVSRLIVLETDKDYEDMGIDKNSNSLLNATKKGKGAVPEPHEWVLIILGAGALLFLIGKRNNIF